MATNVSIQYNGGLLSDIILLVATISLYHRPTTFESKVTDPMYHSFFFCFFLSQLRPMCLNVLSY